MIEKLYLQSHCRNSVLQLPLQKSHHFLLTPEPLIKSLPRSPGSCLDKSVNEAINLLPRPVDQCVILLTHMKWCLLINSDGLVLSIVIWPIRMSSDSNLMRSQWRWHWNMFTIITHNTLHHTLGYQPGYGMITLICCGYLSHTYNCWPPTDSGTQYLLVTTCGMHRNFELLTLLTAQYYCIWTLSK